MLYYYGTALNEAGHYFWVAEGRNLIRSKITFSDLPFDPEKLPLSPSRTMVLPNGTVGFYCTANGFMICAIQGSCYDHRINSRSVFFTNDRLTTDQFKHRILDTNWVASKIISQMPFEILWPDRIQFEYIKI